MSSFCFFFLSHLDFINLMSYDLHGSWENVLGHNSPLYSRSQEAGDQATVNQVKYSYLFIFIFLELFRTITLKRWGSPWSWSHDRWINSYLCNQCLSHQSCAFESRSSRYNIMWYSLPVTYGGFLSVASMTRYNWNIVESGAKHHNPPSKRRGPGGLMRYKVVGLPNNSY